MFEYKLQHRVTVPFRQLPYGLYLIKQQSRVPIVEHYGILIVGKALMQLGIDNLEPVVIHQTYPYVKADWAVTTGSWEITEQIHPQLIPHAIARMRFALKNPSYDLLTNNCEQFARFVAEGKNYSTQVRNGVLIGGVLLAIAIMMAHESDS